MMPQLTRDAQSLVLQNSKMKGIHSRLKQLTLSFKEKFRAFVSWFVLWSLTAFLAVLSTCLGIQSGWGKPQWVVRVDPLIFH